MTVCTSRIQILDSWAPVTVLIARLVPLEERLVTRLVSCGATTTGGGADMGRHVRHVLNVICCAWIR